jgi:predicted DNA-binding ribbon-helix-helix protein
MERIAGGDEKMVKPKDGKARITYSVRLNPDLLKQLKHIAVDDNKTVGELIEEGINLLLEKRSTSRKE